MLLFLACVLVTDDAHLARVDADGDGYVSEAFAGDDCDDANASAHPGATEVCDDDDVDEDCNGEADGSGAAGESPWYRDADGDGYGDEGDSRTACDAPEAFVLLPGDCDDEEDSVNPAATELCDRQDVDENCDGAAEEAGAEGEERWFPDDDGDGFGASAPSELACDAPTGFVDNDQDCDDADEGVSPAAAELCNGEDDDCDGNVEPEGTASVVRDGEWADVSGEVDGTPVEPVEYEIPEGSVLHLCAGTYRAHFTFAGDEAWLTGAGADLTKVDARFVGAPVTVAGGVAHVDGVTLTNGELGVSVDDGGELHLADSVVTGNGDPEDFVGGGVYVGNSASAALRSVRLVDNVAGYGGGLFVNRYASAELEDCEVSGNLATITGGGLSMYFDAASLLLIDTVVADNVSEGDGGGASVLAGALECRDTYAYDEDNAGFFSNTAAEGGGGVDLASAGSLVSKGCDWIDNTAGGAAADVGIGTARHDYDEDETFTCEAGVCD